MGRPSPPAPLPKGGFIPPSGEGREAKVIYAKIIDFPQLGKTKYFA
jgi:hypothetical protein